MTFNGNCAELEGGAIFMNDNTTSNGCSNNTECFVQLLALHPIGLSSLRPYILFEENFAPGYGVRNDIYGGLLDRCIPSPFSSIYPSHEVKKIQYKGIRYLHDNSNISLNSISSQPVQVQFCNHSQAEFAIKRGGNFTVSVVAMDQANHQVNATIMSTLSSSAYTEVDQRIIDISATCTNLTYNVFSCGDSDSVTMTVFDKGPCRDSELSIQTVNIQFEPCNQSIGFQFSDKECKCACDPQLTSFITNCNISTNFLVKVNKSAWIGYNYITNKTGYIIHPYCPFDYYHSPGNTIHINLNDLHGSDAQCNNNRTGILCGACKPNFNLSLGSSSCLSCPDNWPALFVPIFVVAIIAGIMLVTVLLALNMTVIVGLISSLVFFANIAAVNESLFFSSTDSYYFPRMLIAWLNLEIGIDVCFIKGLNASYKLLLQLAFPIYIISLVFVIKVSGWSSRFAKLIGKRDPVAILATLILLSYTKLLSLHCHPFNFKYPTKMAPLNGGGTLTPI